MNPQRYTPATPQLHNPGSDLDSQSYNNAAYPVAHVCSRISPVGRVSPDLVYADGDRMYGDGTIEVMARSTWGLWLETTLANAGSVRTCHTAVGQASQFGGMAASLDVVAYGEDLATEVADADPGRSAFRVIHTQRTTEAGNQSLAQSSTSDLPVAVVNRRTFLPQLGTGFFDPLVYIAAGYDDIGPYNVSSADLIDSTLAQGSAIGVSAGRSWDIVSSTPSSDVRTLRVTSRLYEPEDAPSYAGDTRTVVVYVARALAYSVDEAL